MQGVAGGIFQMISHGIVSGALFLCVGVIYDRMHTREIAAYGGLVNRVRAPTRSRELTCTTFLFFNCAILSRVMSLSRGRS